MFSFCADAQKGLTQGPSLWGARGDMSPQLLDRGDIISFVPPNIL